jgi:hypothetical protein
MILPEPEDLQALCVLIGGEGASFVNLAPPDRIEVLKLFYAADQAHSLDTIREWFEKSKLWEGRVT